MISDARTGSWGLFNAVKPAAAIQDQVVESVSFEDFVWTHPPKLEHDRKSHPRNISTSIEHPAH